MSVSIDPRKAHAVHHKGDVMVVLTWVNDERAMVLLPARRAIGSPWYVVMESAAYKYDDPHYLGRAAMKAAEVLGMDETKSTWVRIAEMISNYLPDLIRMPPAPAPEKLPGTFGTMRLTADSEVVAERDITIEDRGLEYVPA